MIEIWKPVYHLVGTQHEDYYEVSNLGRVRSLDRVVEFVESGRLKRRRCRGQVVRTWRTGDRKERNAVALWRGSGASEVDRCIVAILVFEAFNGRFVQPEKWIIHINKNWADDRLENLAEVDIPEATGDPHRRQRGRGAASYGSLRRNNGKGT